MNEFRDDTLEIPEGEACGADLACQEHSYQEEGMRPYELSKEKSPMTRSLFDDPETSFGEESAGSRRSARNRNDEGKGNKGGADDFFTWFNKSKDTFIKRGREKQERENEDILKRIAQLGEIRKLVDGKEKTSSQAEEEIRRELQDLTQALIFKNSRLIIYIARKEVDKYRKLLPDMDIDDWFNEIVSFGFQKSIEKYDPAKGLYVTWLTTCLKYAGSDKMKKEGVESKDILFKKKEFKRFEHKDGENVLYDTMLKAGLPEVNGKTSLQKLNGFVADRNLLQKAIDSKAINSEEGLPQYLKVIKPADFGKASLFDVYRFNRDLIHFIYPSLAPPFEHGKRALCEVSATDLSKKRNKRKPDEDGEDDFLEGTPDDFRNDVGPGDNEEARIDCYNKLREYLGQVYAASVEELSKDEREIIKAIDRISSARRRNVREESIGGYVQKVRGCNHDTEKRLIGTAHQSFALAFSRNLVGQRFSDIIEYVDPLSFFLLACDFCRSKGLRTEREGLFYYLLDAIVAKTNMGEDIQNAADRACAAYQENGEYASLLTRMKQDPGRTQWNPDYWIKTQTWIKLSPAAVKAELFTNLAKNLAKELERFCPYPYDDCSQGSHPIYDVVSRSRDNGREVSYSWVMERIDRLPCIRNLLSTRFAEYGVKFQKVLKSREDIDEYGG